MQIFPPVCQCKWHCSFLEQRTRRVDQVIWSRCRAPQAATLKPPHKRKGLFHMRLCCDISSQSVSRSLWAARTLCLFWTLGLLAAIIGKVWAKCPHQESVSAIKCRCLAQQQVVCSKPRRNKDLQSVRPSNDPLIVSKAVYSTSWRLPSWCHFLNGILHPRL